MKMQFKNTYVDIKQARESDVRYCYNLSKKNMLTYREQNRSFIDYKNEFVMDGARIIFYKGKRYGFFEFQKKKDGCYVWDIQLSSILQRHGLGTKILEYIETTARKNKDTRLVLFTDPKNPARNLYKRLGFKTILQNKEKIKMEKKL